METIIAFVLVFSASTYGGGRATTVSPILYPTAADCKRVADHGGSNAVCVQTRVLVPKR